ncbi:MAG TPA: polysaccharide deacetylase family protein [Terriglobales bacterium]|nr:polysaccharide deacetylase family protein [Terriglobales bacterium]
MQKYIRRAALEVLRTTGVFRMVRDSRWRQRRLLILCYHGIAQEDEHEWRPRLFMHERLLEARLETLKREQCNVVGLAEGLEKLQAGELPPRSVAITFDDGCYDFYAKAYPLLHRYGFPVTVYQTTYYSDFQRPIFNLICSYMLWKRRGSVLDRGAEIELPPTMDLRTEESRQEIVFSLVQRSEKQGLTGAQKDELASRLAKILDIDYEALARKRIVQLMTPAEVAELSAAGVDFQLHTHRHRTPKDENLFRREIVDNRQWLQRVVGKSTAHFCYPAGDYDPQFLPWLRADGVVSATTCDAGLATAESESLLLPRFVDTSARSATEFESWLTGVGELLSFRKEASRHRLQMAGFPKRA